MGTRCLTFVYDGDLAEPAIINMYRQYDGYPSGHGAELARFLDRGRLINGLTGRDPHLFNGMGCLAAQMVAHFKQEPGGFYIHPVTDTECGQDYEYHVYQVAGQLRVQVRDRGCNLFGLTMSDRNLSLFDGTVAELVEFCGEPITA